MLKLLYFLKKFKVVGYISIGINKCRVQTKQYIIMIKDTLLLLLTVLPFPNTLNEHLLEKIHTSLRLCIAKVFSKFK